MTTCTDTTKRERWLSMRGRWVDDGHFKKYCPNTLCCLECERRTDFSYDGGVGWGAELFSNCPRPKLSVHLADLAGTTNKILIMPTRHAALLVPRGAEDTPLALHARGSSTLPGPVLQGSPRERPARRRRLERPQLREGGAAAGQPRGGVRATSPASPGGPRSPTGRRPCADRSEGFRSRSRRRPRARPSPASPAPRPRGPRRSPGPGHEPGGPPGFRPPGRRPQNPARPPQRTGKGREPTARRPASSSSLQPRPRPASHRPPPNPSRLRQAAPARARSSPATRPGPQHTAPTGCVHRK